MLASFKTLFFNFYIPNEKNRQSEIFYCAEKNIESFDRCAVFINEDDIEKFYNNFRNDSVILKKINNLPTYNDFINYINETTSENDINVIMNSDCFFDKDSFNKLELIKEDELWAISRYNIINEEMNLKPHHTNESQDVWVFKGKPKEIKNINFNFGKAGCDNRFAFEAKSAGYKVINPCLDIKVIHYHLSNIRTYGDTREREKYRIIGQYLKVPPQKITK